MKREPNLIREILLFVEQQPVGFGVSSLDIDGYGKDIICEHVRLLEEANYIEAQINCSPNHMGEIVVRSYNISRLLNPGHDFIADAKNEIIWKQSINHIKEKGVDVSLAVLKGVLTLKKKYPQNLPFSRILRVKAYELRKKFENVEMIKKSLVLMWI